MAITIEKGIPVPPKSVGGRPSKYPFGEMKVGDSFAIGIPAGREQQAIVTNLSSSAQAWVRRTPESPISFTVRAVVEEGSPLVRCWAEAKRVK